MSESQKPLKDSSENPALNLDELEQLHRFTTKTTGTSPTPQTEVPSTAISKTSAGTTVPQKRTNTLDIFEQEIGGREVLIDNLSLLPLDKKQQHFLYLLCDEKMTSQPLSIVARVAGTTSTAVLELFAEAAKRKSLAISMGLVSVSTPRILRDIVDKSVDAKVECPECMGVVIEGIDCDRCHGRGVVLRESSIDHQKLVLETAGILKKGPGVAVQVNQNVGNTTMSGTFFSKFVAQSDQAAYDVEAEVIETDDK